MVNLYHTKLVVNGHPFIMHMFVYLYYWFK